MKTEFLQHLRLVAWFSLLLGALPARADFPALQWAVTPVHPVTQASGYGWNFSGDVATDAAGNLYATVTHHQSYPVPPAYLKHTLKLSPDGTTLWNSPAGGNQIIVDSTGHVIVLDGPVVHRFSPAGQLLWSQSLTFAPVRAAVAPDGGIFVCGSAPATAPATSQFMLQKLTAAGSVAWTRFYTGSAPGASAATSLVALPDNGVAAGGYSFESGHATSTWLVLRYSSAGAFEWIHTAEPGRVMSMTAAGSEVICAGQWQLDGESLFPGTPVVVKRFTADGSLAWSTSFEHPLSPDEQNPWLQIQGLAADETGAVCVIYHHHSVNVELRDTYDSANALWLSSSGGTPRLHTIHFRTDLHRGVVFPAAVCARPGGGFFASAASTSSQATSKIRLHTDGTFLDAAGPPPGAPQARSCVAAAAGPLGYCELSWDALQSFTNAGDLRLLRYASPIAAPPIVTTTAASAVLRISATLNGTVNTFGQPGECWFEYGPAAAYGSASAHQVIQAGTAGVIPFATSLAGLTPGVEYHFRIVSSTPAGTVSGSDMTFTTPVSPWGEFVLQWFGSPSAASSGLLEDPDHDGLANFVEHALGTSPLAGNAVDLVPSIWTSPDSGIPYLSIVYKPAAGDIAYTPEASNSTAPGSWVTTGIQIMDEPGGKKRAVARGFQRFLRLRLSYAP